MVDQVQEVQPIYSSLGDDPDLGEIVEMFVEEMPDRIATILAQFNGSDWGELRRAAHQLKGAAGSYGFDTLSPIAGRLEGLLDHEAPEEQISQAIDELVGLCWRCRAGVPD